MAVHTVPQDVETDDKILGPFNLRQFIYLIVVVALGGIAYLLGRVFIALAVIPVPFMLFFLVLALPLKKDQPMETFLAAKISFMFKNNKRFWIPGQSETTIQITEPKKVEENRTKGLSRQEVARRLSFLADIVDTEGYAIKGTNPNLPFNQEVYAEAESITDMYEATETNQNIDNTFQENNLNNRQNVIEQMRQANSGGSNYSEQAPNVASAPVMPEPMSFQAPPLPATPDYYDAPQAYNEPAIATEEATSYANQDMVNLANNTDFSVETIAKEANRIADKQKPDGEVYISLH